MNIKAMADEFVDTVRSFGSARLYPDAEDENQALLCRGALAAVALGYGSVTENDGCVLFRPGVPGIVEDVPRTASGR